MPPAPAPTPRAIRCPRSGRAIWGLVLALLAVSPAAAAAPVPEYNAKAGYLLLFTRYVTWPEQAFQAPDRPIVIGVLGENPFGAVLGQTVRDLKSQGRPLEVRLVHSVDEAAQCHVIFISRRDQQAEVDWLRQLQGRPVLTVTESGYGLEHGAVLSLTLEESLRGTRVAFSASLPAARANGLQLSASMLASAREVRRQDAEKGPGS